MLMQVHKMPLLLFFSSMPAASKQGAVARLGEGHPIFSQRAGRPFRRYHLAGRVHLQDALLHRAQTGQPVDLHLSALPQAVHAPHRLVLQLLVHTGVHQDDVAGLGHVKPHRARPHGQQEDRGGRVVAEVVQRLLALHHGHVGGQGAELEAVAAERAHNAAESGSELGEDEHLDLRAVVPDILQGVNQPGKLGALRLTSSSSSSRGDSFALVQGDIIIVVGFDAYRGVEAGVGPLMV